MQKGKRARPAKTAPKSCEQLTDEALRVYLYRLGTPERKDVCNALLFLAEEALTRVMRLQGFELTNNLAQMMLVRLRHDRGLVVSPEPPVRLQ